MELHVDTIHQTRPALLEFIYDGDAFIGEAKPVISSCRDGVCYELEVMLNGVNLGLIRCTQNGWKMEADIEQSLIDEIGKRIFIWYE